MPTTKRCRTLLATTALAFALALPALPALASGPGSVHFDEASFSIAESAGVARVTIERSHGEDGAISVEVSTTGGSATAGADYQPVATTVTWADGDETNRIVEIAIVDDGEAEGAETIELALANVTGGATIDGGSSTVTIEANDGGSGGGGGGDDGGGDGGGDDGGGGDGSSVFHFDERGYVSNEGVGLAVITVERSHGEHGAASVDYATTDGTANAPGDYASASGTLSWADGEEGVKSFTIAIVADGVAEPNETVHLALSNPTGGAAIDPDRGDAVLTIVDGGGTGDDGGGDDSSSEPGTLKFDETSFEVVEGEVSAVVRVERSHGSHGAVSVDYSTADGSAAAGADYESASGTLSWAPGDESTKTFVVPIHADDLTEGNETVNLTLSNPTGGAVLDAERDAAILDLLDDDGSQQPCSPDDSTLCLGDDRFSVQVTYRTAQGATGAGHMAPLSANAGTVWFFDPANAEVLVKVLDACGFPGAPAYWVFYAATTNVDFTLRVTDRRTGLTKEYRNRLGQAAAPVQDVATFKTCN